MQSISSTAEVDLRPSADTGGGNWDDAVRKRDEIADIIRLRLERSRTNALLQISQRGVFPPWVRLEVWRPIDGTQARERSELEFVVESVPFNRSPIVLTARLKRGKRSMAHYTRPHFSTDDVAEWVDYTLGHRHAPSNYRPASEAAGRMIRAFLPFPGPDHNPVRREFKGGGAFLVVLGIASVALLVISGISMSGDVDPAFPRAVMLIAIAGVLLTGWLSSRTRRLVSPAVQPRTTPVRLHLVDSWHEVIPGLGRDFELIRARLLKELGSLQLLGMSSAIERFGYDTPQGYEERDRIVISKGQCVVHVHLHPFGDDVFVAWQSNLNWGKWSETAPVSSRSTNGATVQFLDIRPGFYIPSEIDLIDLNALSDLVHRRLTGALKALLRERAIDADIDFEIVRGDRDGAINAKRQGNTSNSSNTPSDRTPGTMSWKPQAVTEMEKSAGPIAAVQHATERSPSFAPLTLGILAAVAAAAGAYALAAFGLLFASNLFPNFPLSDTFQYAYNPVLDLPQTIVLAVFLLFVFGAGLHTSIAIFILLAATGFLSDLLYNVAVSRYFETNEEFMLWVSAEHARALVWVPYIILSGAAALAALSLLLPEMARASAWLRTLPVLVLAQIGMWAAGPLALGYPLDAISFLIPNFIFCGSIVYWLSRPENRRRTK